LLGLDGRMELAISASALRSFCELAKINHIVYKFQIFKVLLDVSTEQQESFADHTACRIGKWSYEGEDKNDFSKSAGFAELEEPHKSFHQYAVSTLHEFKNSNQHTALRSIETMETSSFRIIAASSEKAATEKYKPDGDVTLF